jgi:hypothetical protein
MAVAIFLFIVALAALAVIALQNVLHYKEKKEIFNRFFAGDYKTYKQFEEILPAKMKADEKIREEERKKVLTPAELEARTKAGRF